MFTRQHSILQDELGEVKVDPALERARISRVLMYIGAAMLVTSSILLILLHESNPFPSIIYIIIFATNIPVIISAIKRVRYQERLEQRRQAAARGDHNLLASEQPQPDATALPLPITLRRRHSRHSRVRYMQIRLLVIGLLLALIVLILMYVVLSYLLPLLPGSRLPRKHLLGSSWEASHL